MLSMHPFKVQTYLFWYYITYCAGITILFRYLHWSTTPSGFRILGLLQGDYGNFFIYSVRKQYEYVLDTDYVESLIRDNKSILFSLLSKRYFLKRYTEVKYDSLRYLIDVQKRINDPNLFITWNDILEP